jgi:uncharacterized membrane protein YeaQ/YmgE (transglycosylase-associated protein family)
MTTPSQGSTQIVETWLGASLWGEIVMTVEGLVIWLIIGAIAGWLAGLIMKGYGFGLVGNIVVGIVGASIAGWLLPRIGFVFIGGIGAEIINAVIGGSSSFGGDWALQKGSLKIEVRRRTAPLQGAARARAVMTPAQIFQH